MKFFKKKDKDKRKDSSSHGHSASEGGDGSRLRIRGFGAPSRDRARSRDERQFPSEYYSDQQWHIPPPTRDSAVVLAKFSEHPKVLRRIFALLAPQSEDNTYEKCEDSFIEDACMLCDMRDLAHCVAVCRAWRGVATGQLYKSIRIDSVHYCAREAFLSDRRKRGSFFDRNGDPEDTAAARLSLLCRTLRDDPTRLGVLVEFLKIPYMLRESSQADLARTIAVLPNLRFVDLPEGLFTDDPSYLTLRLEVQARCHNLRKMTYMHGAERSLEMLAGGKVWQNLNVLDLVRIQMEPNRIRQAIGSLRNLRALKVTEGSSGPHAFTDEMFYHSDYLLPFPPLEELILTDTRRVTAEGLKHYLARPDARATLKVMSLTRTRVKVWTLQEVLSIATSLKYLTIVDSVKATLPLAAGTHDIAPLSSASLETLNYEITADGSLSPYAGVTSSYYNFLSGSLISGGLPSLRTVYVRDPNFPDLLVGNVPPLAPPLPSYADPFNRRPASSGSPTSPQSIGSQGLVSPRTFLSPPISPNGPPQQPPTNQFANLSIADPRGSLIAPNPAFASQHSNPNSNPRFSSNNPFASLLPPKKLHTLEVFAKGDDDLDWSSVKVNPRDARASQIAHSTLAVPTERGARPSVSYGLGRDVRVGPHARRSVFVASEAGGFLAVPGSDGGHGAVGNGGGRGASTGGFGGGAGGNNGRRGSAPEVSEWPFVAPEKEGRRERMDLWR